MKKIIALLLLLSVLLALCACKPNEDNPPPTDDENGGIFEPDAELIEAIVKILDPCQYSSVGEGMTVATAIDQIESGSCPYYLDFAHGESYFVAACLPPSGQELSDLSELSWIGFEDADDIIETYKGLTISSVFQINVSPLSRNLMTEESVDGSVFVITGYEPEYVNGVNTKEERPFISGALYVTEYEENVYLENINFMLTRLDCVTLDGCVYVTVLLDKVYPSGETYEVDLTREFCEYYDAFMNVMITGEYSKTSSDGTVTNYGLISLDDFMKIVKDHTTE